VARGNDGPLPIRYVARPYEIEAVQWNGVFEDLPAEWRTSGFLELTVRGVLIVRTLDGAVRVRPGDFIIRGPGADYSVGRPPQFLWMFAPKQ
jgi:hypothetical protein